MIDPPPLPPAKPFPGIAQTFGLLFVALVLGLFALVMLFVAYALVTGDSPEPNAWMIIVGNTAGLMGAAALGYRVTRLERSQVFPWGGFDLRLIPPMMALVGGIVLALGAFEQLLLNNLLQDEGTRSWLEEQVEEIMRLLLADRPSAFLAVVIVAPFTEEIFFRGLVLSGFLRRYSQRRAIWSQAALFALMHMNPVQLPFTFFLGALFGWLRLRTGSLWPPVLCHALNNGAVLLAAWTWGEEAVVPFWMLFLGVALALIGFRVIGSTVREQPEVLPPDNTPPPGLD